MPIETQQRVSPVANRRGARPCDLFAEGDKPQMMQITPIYERSRASLMTAGSAFQRLKPP
jgi:hypothetical protein